MNVFGHPDVPEITLVEMESIGSSCPAIGKVATALGKSTEDLDFLRRFRPRWASASFWRQWRDEQQKFLLPHGRSVEDDMELYRTDYGNPDRSHSPVAILRPFLRVRLHGVAEKALVDTGASISLISASPSDSVAPLQVPVILASGETELRDFVMIPKVALGHRGFAHFVAGAKREEWATPIIGMSFLLRFASVCFSTHESILYLGGLGPCAAVAPSLEWAFDRSLTLISTAITPGQGNPVMMDTGSDHSTCPMSFYTPESKATWSARKSKSPVNSQTRVRCRSSRLSPAKCQMCLS